MVRLSGFPRALAVSCFLTACALAPADVAADRAQLTDGVTHIEVPGGIPGQMSVSGLAFTVLTGKDGVPLFAATRVGDGRAVAGGHEAFFVGDNLKRADNGKFLNDILAWLSHKTEGSLRVGLIDDDGMKSFLSAEGDQVTTLRHSDLGETILGFDVICMQQQSLDGDLKAQQALTKFLKAGHGALIAGPGWGWASLHGGGKGITSLHSGNRLLNPYGIGFTVETLDGPYTTAGAENPLLNADEALTALSKPGLNPTDSAIVGGSISRALELETPGLRLRLKQLLKDSGKSLVPTASHPVTAPMALARIAAKIQFDELQGLPPEQVTAYAGASDFPGSVPATASRIAKDVSVDTSVPQWHGTGLYAAPGEVVTITIPDSAAGAGLYVRIGSQTDTLWGNDSWSRFPEISLRRPLDHKLNKVASAFGGAIYIDVPPNCTLGTISVTVAHAVTAPRFVRGQTTLAEWRNVQRNAPAPWAELEGHKVILSVPSSAVRDLQDPEALMAFWDQMMDDIFAFYAAPHRLRPERYSVDRQISVGYMHNGYPIMTFEDVSKLFCDLPKLRQGKGSVWGFYHEMGHNFQRPEWTFEGTGEVTNNLFSLYARDKINATPVGAFLFEPDKKKKLAQYVAEGSRFEKWQSDPFLALIMYAELIERFGWEPFTKVFADYWATPVDQLPKSDLQKRDQWMVRFSRAVRRDLGPFFLAWGIPTSQQARESIASFRPWMPPDWPKRQ